MSFLKHPFHTAWHILKHHCGSYNYCSCDSLMVSKTCHFLNKTLVRFFSVLIFMLQLIIISGFYFLTVKYFLFRWSTKNLTNCVLCYPNEISPLMLVPQCTSLLDKIFLISGHKIIWPGSQTWFYQILILGVAVSAGLFSIYFSTFLVNLFIFFFYLK